MSGKFRTHLVKQKADGGKCAEMFSSQQDVKYCGQNDALGA